MTLLWNQASLDERVVVDGHGCHKTLNYGVKAKENQDNVPTLYWLPCLHKTLRSKIYYPHAFLKKRRGYCNRLRPSVCPSVRPSRYILLNHWTKSNQIWCVSCSHEWGAQRHIFWARPLGPWGGAKRSNIIKFQLQSQFQRFFNQTLCVFSHMKDIKHIRRDFHLVAWVMPQGSDLGVPWGGLGGSIFFSKFNQIWFVSYLHEWHKHRHHFLGPRPLGPWGGAKGSKIV